MDKSLMNSPAEIIESKVGMTGVPRKMIIFHSSMNSIWPANQKSNE